MLYSISVVTALLPKQFQLNDTRGFPKQLQLNDGRGFPPLIEQTNRPLSASIIRNNLFVSKPNIFGLLSGGSKTQNDWGFFSDLYIYYSFQNSVTTVSKSFFSQATTTCSVTEHCRISQMQHRNLQITRTLKKQHVSHSCLNEVHIPKINSACDN